jgi:hypothetical protein
MQSECRVLGLAAQPEVCTPSCVSNVMVFFKTATNTMWQKQTTVLPHVEMVLP